MRRHASLNVVDQPDRDPAAAIVMLQEPPARPAALPRATITELEARPSAILRRRIEQALGLLRRRPPDQAEQRARLRALHQQLTRLTGQPPRLQAATAGTAHERLREVRIELDRSSRSTGHGWTGTRPTRTPWPKAASPRASCAAANSTPSTTSPTSRPPT